MQLFEKIQTIKETVPEGYATLPGYIRDSLHPGFELRPYQVDAFCNFITYFENDKLRNNPSQVLFHAATGSGKTLLMAGLILYLYKQGYRNFLFFVNSTNIIEKTKENFLNAASSKYLFNNTINIDGETVRIHEVENFAASAPNGINICFTTIQGLYSLLNCTRENSITFDDFSDKKTVLISDESHHINVETKKGKLTIGELTDKNSWELCIRRIFNKNNANVLLEFTATCDLENSAIKAKYEDKIIFDYPLRQFRGDGFSKEVKVFQLDASTLERAILATCLSHCRYKIFQHHKLTIKPVILFKSQTIAQSREFYAEFHQTLADLTGVKLKAMVESVNHPLLAGAFAFFRKTGTSYAQLVAELQEEFCDTRSLIVNSKDDSESKQLLVNSLESPENPYRAIFAVDQLNEGWDVLNLFDIVRTYTTRDAKAGKPGKTTIQEAQLLGRGARYCPFVTEETKEPFGRYRRKFDADLENPLRICETLYYHCTHNPKYVEELTTALRETGLFDENFREIDYIIKPNFKNSSFYENGLVFINERSEKSRKEVYAIPESIRTIPYEVQIATGKSEVENVLGDRWEDEPFRLSASLKRIRIKVKDIPFAISYKALRQYPRYRFETLQKYFPNLRTVRDFLSQKSYLGDITITIETAQKQLKPRHFYRACLNVFGKIEKEIGAIETTYRGSHEFTAVKLRHKFTDKKVRLSNDEDAELGKAQSESKKELQLDLPNRDWYVYNDCFGTSEEKHFLRYFDAVYDRLRTQYDEVYLIRNERQLAIYSFEDGSRFEPDFMLFLRKKGESHGEQYQLFIEPKGEHLLEKDAWKESFLQSIAEQAIPVKRFADDNEYRIIGLPFYNRSQREEQFDQTLFLR